MTIIKTVTTWNSEQSEEQLAASSAYASQMQLEGLTNGLVTVVTEPGVFPVIKERTWTTVNSAENWVSFVLALPYPPVSSVVVEQT